MRNIFLCLIFMFIVYFMQYILSILYIVCHIYDWLQYLYYVVIANQIILKTLCVRVFMFEFR